MANGKRIACLALLSAGALLADQFTGWITDAKCARDPANNFIGETHKKCVEQGQPIVFVNGLDKSVHLITNADRMKEIRDAVGHKVTIEGVAKGGGAIEVLSLVEATPAP